MKERKFLLVTITSFLFCLGSVGQTAITTFTPTSGPVGTAITLNGVNFDPSPGNNVVLFGSTVASVTSATSTQLTVLVPSGSSYCPISVTNLTTNQTAYSVTPFVVKFSFCGLMGPTSFASPVQFTAGTNPQNMALVDLDGDGKPDLLSTSSMVSVYRNTSISGTVSFATKIDFVIGTGAYGIITGDLDGDGKPDLIATNPGSNVVSILRNTSSVGMISFASKVDLVTGTTPRGVIVDDFNRDGKPDLAVANSTSNTVSILENSSTVGSLIFSPKVDFSVGQGAWGIASGDLDGDGISDLAITNQLNGASPAHNSVSLLRNTTSLGTISFASVVYFATSVSPLYVKIGDIDGDNKADLAVVGSAFSTLRNISTIGNISYSPMVTHTVATGPRGVALGDLDGDGKIDIAVSNRVSDNVSVLINNSVPGSISLAPRVNYSSGASGDPEDLSICDIDGDGIPDITLVNNGPDKMSVVKGVGNLPPTMTSSSMKTIYSGTAFSIPLTSSYSSTYSWVATDNLNTSGESIIVQVTDTLNDLIVNNSSIDQTVNYTVTPTSTIGSCVGASQMVVVTVKLGPPTFFPTSGPVGTVVTISGTNFDPTPANNIVFFGATQAAVSSSTASSLVVLAPAGATFENISVTNTVTSKTMYSSRPFILTFPCGGYLDTFSFAPKQQFVTGNSPFDVGLGDFDGDGKTDVVEVNDAAMPWSSVWVYKNTSAIGALSFAPHVSYSLGDHPEYVSVADFDGDGKLDFVVANSASAMLSLFRNTSTIGSISFAPRIDYSLPSVIYQLDVADIDGDGKLDIAVCANANSIYILRNTSAIGTPTFAAAITLSTVLSPRGIAIGDIDADGWAEIVTVDHVNDLLSIHKNISTPGSILFSPKVDFLTESGPWGVALGDLDEDGKPDIAVSNHEDTTISVFRNTCSGGTISFAPKIDYSTDNRTSGIIIGDIDGDAKLDIATPNFDAGSGGEKKVSIYKNVGSAGAISFAGRIDFLVGTDPLAIKMGDLDGDSKPEIVVSNHYAADKLSILTNHVSISPPFAGDDTLCGSGSVALYASSVVSGSDYNWYDAVVGGTLLQAGGSSFITPSISTTTTYYVTRIDTALCESNPRIPITVTIDSIPATPFITAMGTTLTSSSAGGNQWYLDGVMIVGATSQNYTFTANGTYTVVVKNGSCSSSASSPFVITTTEIEVEAPLSLSVSPNPNNGAFNLQFVSITLSNYKLQVTNVLGQVVYEEELVGFSGTYSKLISIATYGKGVYTVRLTNEKHDVVKKVIVY